MEWNHETVKDFGMRISSVKYFDFFFIYKDTQQSKQQSDCLQIIIYCKNLIMGYSTEII